MNLYEGKKDTDKWFPVRLVDSTDLITEETGKAYGDITCVYGTEAAASETSYTVGSGNWAEQGSGNYWLQIGASEFTAEGKYIVSVACSGCHEVHFAVEVRDDTVAGLIDDVDTILTRIPSALVSGRMSSDAVAISGSTDAADKLEATAEQMIQGTVDTTLVGTTTTTFESDDITEATADHYNGRRIIWTSGNLAGQAATILDYALNAANGAFTVSAEMTEAPANDDTFSIV